MPKRKPPAKIPKEAYKVSVPPKSSKVLKIGYGNKISTDIDETIKLAQESRDYLDKLCSESEEEGILVEAEHPIKKKLMTLADSIEYIGNIHRTRLSQTGMFQKKESNDAYIQELRKLSYRFHKVLNEKLYEDKSINLSRVRNLGVSPTTISFLNKYLSKLLPDLDRAEKWNTARLHQKIGRIDKCLVLEDVKDTFERHGLTVSHYEDAGKKAGATHRSAFYESVYLALAHAGDTVERISKVYEHCKKHKEPTK
mgnify:CR=1 FL=1